MDYGSVSLDINPQTVFYDNVEIDGALARGELSDASSNAKSKYSELLKRKNIRNQQLIADQ